MVDEVWNAQNDERDSFEDLAPVSTECGGNLACAADSSNLVVRETTAVSAPTFT